MSHLSLHYTSISGANDCMESDTISLISEKVNRHKQTNKQKKTHSCLWAAVSSASVQTICCAEELPSSILNNVDEWDAQEPQKAIVPLRTGGPIAGRQANPPVWNLQLRPHWFGSISWMSHTPRTMLNDFAILFPFKLLLRFLPDTCINQCHPRQVMGLNVLRLTLPASQNPLKSTQ
jgi:hypothetical protein